MKSVNAIIVQGLSSTCLVSHSIPFHSNPCAIPTSNPAPGYLFPRPFRLLSWVKMLSSRCTMYTARKFHLRSSSWFIIDVLRAHVDMLQMLRSLCLMVALQEVFSSATPSGRDRSAMVWHCGEDLKLWFEILAEVHD